MTPPIPFDRPLYPVYFRAWEWSFVEPTLDLIREEAGVVEGEPGLSDGRAAELLVADWLARHGA